MTGPRTTRRGEPNPSSGFTGWPSITTTNSASMPIADMVAWCGATVARPRGRAVRRRRRSRLGLAIVIARSERVALELRVERIARGIVGHGDDVPEIEMQMVVGEAAILADGADPRRRQRLARDLRVALDPLTRVQILVADAVDVHRGRPAMRRGMARQLVLRRAIAAVRGDPHRLTDRLAKALEHGGGERHRAGHIARKEAKRGDFPD